MFSQGNPSNVLDSQAMNAGGQQQQQNMLRQAQQQRAMPEPSIAPAESSTHTGPTATAAGNVDQRELVWTKLQILKDIYLQDLNVLYGMLSNRSTQPMPAEHLQKLKHYKDAVQQLIPYLRASKDRIPKEFNQDKLDAFEKQIVIIMQTFKKRRQPQAAPGGPAATGQPPPASQAPAQPAPVQQPDQVNIAGNRFCFVTGLVQAPPQPPSQMPQNGQILQQFWNYYNIQSMQQRLQRRVMLQRQQQQRHHHHQQQQQQQQEQQDRQNPQYPSISPSVIYDNSEV